FNRREGARFWFWREEVALHVTQPIRRKALEIIHGVIAIGSWKSAIAAIAALESAIHRVAPVEAKRVEDGDALRDRWRPERLGGLESLRFALNQHDHFLVRYSVRMLLLSDLFFEGDAEFKSKARSLVETIESDLNLRVASALLDATGNEFLDETDKGSGHD